MCKCKSVAIDGGMSYAKRCGDSWIDVSDEREATIEEKRKYIEENIDKLIYMFDEKYLDTLINQFEVFKYNE